MKNGLKRFLSALLTLVMAFSLAAAAPTAAIPANAAENGAVTLEFIIGDIIYKVNGVSTAMDVAPVVLEARTMLPIRFVAEPLGALVGWDESTSKVTVQLMDTKIELWIGQSNALVNGVTKPIDPDNANVKPLLLDSRTMLPIRFVTENLGCDVDWQEATQKVTITRGTSAGGGSGSDGSGSGGDAADDIVDEGGDVSIVGGEESDDAPYFACNQCGLKPADQSNPPNFCSDCGGAIVELNAEPGESDSDTGDDDSKNVPGTFGKGLKVIERDIRSQILEQDIRSQILDQNFEIAKKPDIIGEYLGGGTVTNAVRVLNINQIQDIAEIGRGYDVFKSYADTDALKNAVLDIDKLTSGGQVWRAEYDKGYFDEIEGRTIEEYMQNATTRVSASAGFMGFGASVKTNYSEASYSSTENYFLTLQYIVNKQNLFLDGTCIYRNYLRDNVKEILETGKLTGDPVAWDANRIFETFGAYVLVDGIFGGRLDYSVAANKTASTSYENFKACVKADYNGVLASATATVEHETTQNKSKYDEKRSIRLTTYGGGASINGKSLATDADGSRISAWSQAVENSPMLVEFGTTGSRPLIPIWELCSDYGNPDGRGAQLEKAFEEYAKGKELKVTKISPSKYVVDISPVFTTDIGAVNWLNAGRNIPGGGNINEKGTALYLFYMLGGAEGNVFGGYMPITDLFAGYYPYDAGRKVIPVPEHVYQGETFLASHNGNTANFHSKINTNYNMGAKNVYHSSNGLWTTTHTRNAGHIYLFMTRDVNNTSSRITDIEVVKPASQSDLNTLLLDKSWTFVSLQNQTTPFNFNTDVTGAPEIYIRYKRE